jgi:hypothetical protein
MVMLRWVAPPRVSHLAPGRVAPFWLHRASQYHGRPYHQFGLGRSKVHVDIPAHPTDPTMMAWFIMARDDDLDDTLERAAHHALMEFCEHHLPSSATPLSPCSPFGTRETRCGVSVWPPSVTQSSRHATPST